jgi:hypothetical protein
MEGLVAAGQPTPIAAILALPRTQLVFWISETCFEGKQRVSLLSNARTCLPSYAGNGEVTKDQSCEQAVHPSSHGNQLTKMNAVAEIFLFLWKGVAETFQVGFK